MKVDDVIRLDTSESRLAATEYLVQATHEEGFMLWKTWHEKFEWVQITHGFGHVVGNVRLQKPNGEFESMPVAISMWWGILEGHLVCFYEDTSLVVDHRMIEKWIRPQVKKHTNATNFHQCIHDLNLMQRTTPEAARS